MIHPSDLQAAAAALEDCRWARLGACSVVSRSVHAHGSPGDGTVGVHLGMDAGRNLYGLAAPGQVLHIDVFHSPGLCAADRLRAALVAVARRYLAGRGDPPDETQRVLAWVEARASTEDESPEDAGTASAWHGAAARPGSEPREGGAARCGHVHLALRLDAVPLAFAALAAEAAEEAILGSGLSLLPVEGIEATWESSARPPCACGTGAAAPAAGSARGVRLSTAPGSGSGGPPVPATRESAAPWAESHPLAVPAALQLPAAARDARRPLGDGRAAPSAGREGVPGAAGAPLGHRSANGAEQAPGPRLRRDAFRGAGGASHGPSRRRVAADRPRRATAGPARVGVLLPVETAAAAAMDGSPLGPSPQHLRYAPRRSRRPAPVLVAVDRSPSMGGRLDAVCAWVQALAIEAPGRAVGLYALPLDASGSGAVALSGDGRSEVDLAPTRNRAALAAALQRTRTEPQPGETDLAAGLRALARHLRQGPARAAAVCCVVTDGLATGPGDAFAAALAAARDLRGAGRARVVFCGWPSAGTRLRALAAAAGGRWHALKD